MRAGPGLAKGESPSGGGSLLLRWILNALALLLTAYLVKGVVVRGFLPAVLAAALLGVVNAVIRPVVLLLTLPLNIVTLGLFTLAVNALMLWLVAAVVPGFEVHGFGAALLGSIVLSLISAFLSHLVRY